MTKRMVGHPLKIAPDAEHAARLAEAQQHRAEIDNPNYLDGPEHVIVGERQSGKTRLALRWLLEAPEGVRRVLLTISEEHAKVLRFEAGMHSRDDRIQPYRRVMNRGAERDTEYGIDETVHIIANLLCLREPPRLVTIGLAESWQGTPES